MEPPALAPSRGPGILLGTAGLVVVVAGLKGAGDLLVPLLFAALLGLICVRPMFWLRRRGLGRGPAVLVVLLGLLAGLALLSGVLGRSVVAFQDAMPAYDTRIRALVSATLAWLQKSGLDVEQARVQEALDPGVLLGLVTATLQGFLGLLSNLVLVLLLTAFLLVEADALPGKLRRASRDAAALERWRDVADRIFRYVSLKALLSLVTGVLVTLLLVGAGVDFPVLWGVVAFLFNFIPNLGSVLAAVPPVLLALLQFGTGRAVLVAAGIAAINMVVGNVWEPRLLGRRLGLSPLVVLVSLVFWAWCWGPVGMVLALPMTMVVKLVLEGSPGGRAAAVLLGGGEVLAEADAVRPAASGPPGRPRG